MSEDQKHDVTPYQEFEVKDEEQILAEMKGEAFLSQYVYSFNQGGRTITNLSYIGIKEAIRRRGHYQIIEQTITEVGNKIRVLVKVHDLVNDIDVLGASEAESDKPFAYVLAINKAERNAYAKVIPAKLIAEMIAEKLGKPTMPFKRVEPEQQKPKDVTPPKTEAQQASEVPLSYEIPSWIKPEVMANIVLDETGNMITLKPKAMLNTEDFKDICKVAEKFGGRWVKENGQWEIPQKA